jgi:hypothetical protein
MACVILSAKVTANLSKFSSLWAVRNNSQLINNSAIRIIAGDFSLQRRPGYSLKSSKAANHYTAAAAIQSRIMVICGMPPNNALIGAALLLIKRRFHNTFCSQ